jgi:hypothetical protein
MRENKMKKGIVFETEEFRSDSCVVTGFKKVSSTMARINTFVTQFEFSRRDEDDEGGVNDQLRNEEALLGLI